MSARTVGRLLDDIVSGAETTFALVVRSGRTGEERSFVAVGTPRTGDSVADLTATGLATGRPVVLAVPYNQVRERGFAVRHDATDLVAIECTDRVDTSRTELLRLLPDAGLSVTEEGFDLSDEQYEELVQRVVDDEIGSGEGANFVLHRSYRGRFDRFDAATALTAFRRLLDNETGAYWTFLIALPDRYLVGASPELHIEQDRTGSVRMNPISGTFRFGESAPTVEDYLTFLRDTKEREELFMVVDEELKTMSRIGNGPPRIEGPFLKEMSRLAHTEYFIEVPSDLSPGEILRESLLAPTVTGSPLENACRVIARHEEHDRGYYSGVVAIADPTRGPAPELDSAIVIRTVDIGRDGSFRIPVGATIVRHSDPRSEALETEAKANGLLRALTAPHRRVAGDPQIVRALRDRNIGLARFWIDGAVQSVHDGRRRRVVVVDYEDRFTDMLARQLESLGCDVTWRGNDAEIDPYEGDLTILGPGPGDPTGRDDGRIDNLRAHVDLLLAADRPFLAICLSHQALSAALGLQVRRLPRPNQGTQLDVDYFGDPAKVAFYNTYTAVSEAPELQHLRHGRVQVARLAGTEQVIALRGERFESFQFHPESLLSSDGHRLLHQVLTRLGDAPAPSPDATRRVS